MESEKRQKEFQKNQSLEGLLTHLNGLLGTPEQTVSQNFRMPRYPVVLVVGAPRSGTTLTMQWLAQTGYFAYPTNLLSRFYKAPYIGALIQQLLTAPEYSFNDEILDFNSPINFSSNLGKTHGALAPNEFWYFWRRFIPNIMPEYLDEAALAKIDGPGFAAELAALESVFDKPWAMKGIILELNLAFLSSLLDKALFLFLRRDPVFNAQSLLQARTKFFGTIDEWYSVKPREYDILKNLTPIEQVAGQVHFINRHIEVELRQIDPVRHLTIDYEAFCADPAAIFEQLAGKLAGQGYRADWHYVGPAQFETTNQRRISKADFQKLQAACEHFSI